MSVVRSLTSDKDQEERRQAFLELGAEAARAERAALAASEAARAGRAAVIEAPGAGSRAPPGAPEPSPPVTRSRKLRPGHATATAPLAPRGARPKESTGTLKVGAKHTHALASDDLPPSPSGHTSLLWRHDLDRRLRTMQPQEPNIDDVLNRTHVISKGKADASGGGVSGAADRRAEDRGVTFSVPPQSPTPSRPASVVSRASTIVEARCKQAELEAAEKLAELKREELRIEAELVQRRLAATVSRIEAEASERGEGSVHSKRSDPNRVRKWVDESMNLQDKRPRLNEEQQMAIRDPEYSSAPVETPKTPATGLIRRPGNPVVPMLANREHIFEIPRAPARDPDPERNREHQPEPANERVPEPQTPFSRHTTETTPEAMLNLFERMQMAARPAPKEIYELPHFYGDVSEWRSFINTYNESSRRFKFSDYENVARLRVALKGEAKASVQHILSTATKPDLVIRMLTKQFGRSDYLVDKALDDLRKLPTLGTSANELNTFAIKIMNIVSTLMDLDDAHYANNPLLVREVTDRLSPYLRSRYCDYARGHRHSNTAEIQMIAEFLLEESDIQLEFTHAKAPAMKSAPRGPPQPTNAPRPSAPRTPGRQSTPYPARGGGMPKPLPSKVTYATEKVNYRTATCLYCAGGHRTTECRKLQVLELGARWDWARMNRICFKCMDAKHRREQCKARGCGIAGCPHSHHRLLHQTLSNQAVQSQPTTNAQVCERGTQSEPVSQRALSERRTTADSVSQSQSSYAANTEESEVLLKVVPVTLSGPSGEVDIFCLLDEGSTVSLLEQEIADKIGASGPMDMLTVRGIGDILHREQSQKVNAHIRAKSGGLAHPLSLRTIRQLDLRGQSVSRKLIEQYEHLKEARGVCYEYGVPQLLLGADHWHLLIPEEVRVGPKQAPVAMRCAIGWAIFGRAPRYLRTNEQNVVYHTHHEADKELHELVKNHFAIDALGVGHKDNVRPADERARKLFEESITKRDGRWEVGQLWREDDPHLPPSYAMAYSRLRNLETKMDKDPDFACEYTKQIDNLLIKGYAERLNEPPDSPVAFFMPHFATYNKNKGKWRQVYDAAARTGGLSLNDHILEGPDLLQPLLGILLRFREGKYAVCADIQEMFLQIGVRDKDKPSQMFLWRGARRDVKPEVYVMNRVVFGIVSSPCIAHMVRNHNATMNKDEYPKAVYEIHTNHYMDDYVSSFQNEEDIVETSKQVSDSHAKGGFTLRGWSTNSTQLLDQIPEDRRATEPTLLGDKQLKVLGLTWDPTTDTLGFNTSLLRVPEAVKKGERAPTKRELLSTVMSIYDPMGLIAQYVISAKILMQSIWSRVDWDTAIPDEEAKQFAAWLEALNQVEALRIPRQHAVAGEEPQIDLHIFTDASQVAYSAVGYWRTEANGKVTVSLAAAKARVTPIRIVSVPRAELTAAVIGTRLALTLLEEHRFDVRKVTYWTDSRTVLAWVRDDARRYLPFVSHRIAEIADNSERIAWRWVPSKLNPADDATRLRPAQVISIQDRWYQGPSFLHEPEEKWPPVIDTSDVEIPERRPIKVVLATHEPETSLPDAERFNSHEKLVRATARMLLFIEKLKTKNRAIQLDVRHLRIAEGLLMQRSQRHSFPDELRALSHKTKLSKNSPLYKLDPEISAGGLLVMKTRLNRAPVRFTSEKPVILDGREPYTRLLIKRAHAKGAHVNNEAVVNSLRQVYWITHLRPSVRAIARECALCRLRRAAPRAQPLGDLPAERLGAFQRCFAHAAQDYFGPCWVTIGRRREKRWVALYTCLTTRAVHLEVVHSLSTDSAINALRRFAARRGWPHTMWSDNQTSFRAAALELKAAHEEWLPALRDYGLRQRMTWRFIAPAAPNQGGSWERLVKTVKNALSYVLNEKAPSDEVFVTLLAEIENVVNSRPLTHVPVEPNDDRALTPNDFILLDSTPQPLVGPCQEADKKKWRQIQALANHFWQRWVREYYPLLAPRQTSSDGGRQIQIGDCVLVVDPASPRNVWPRGLVVATYPGPDGKTRTVDVRTKHGVLRRPTLKLAVLVPVSSTSSTDATRSAAADGGENVDDGLEPRQNGGIDPH